MRRTLGKAHSANKFTTNYVLMLHKCVKRFCLAKRIEVARMNACMDFSEGLFYIVIFLLRENMTMSAF